jgi:putative ABC transport system permease protein
MLIVDGDPGHTPTVPAGLTVSSRAEAHKQLLRPWGQAINSLTIFAVLLWVVAAAIVGSALYLSAIERTRDFAVFRATGSTTRALVAGLLAQAAVLTSASGVLAIVIAVAISPVFPLPVTVTLSQMVVTLVVSIVVGLFAAMTGLRRAVSVEPALAFAGRT